MSKYELKITLKSDLCPGSGYAYSGLIDSDVCFDEYGIPFIPGRRLKGCLKESADILEANGFFKEGDLSAIFGAAGQEKAGSILVGNAYIEGYEELKKDLATIMEAARKSKKEALISSQKILESFTSVKAQTRLKDGVAMEDTLRYTRVVNRYALGSDDKPEEPEELTFTAEITLDEKYMPTVEKIAQATRNIGMDRNRGLGSIVCRLKDKQDTDIVADVFCGTWDGFEPDGDVEIKISLTNTAPLMISADNDEVSLKYIPARSLIGALAGIYLKDESKKAESEEFKDLFLNGTTKYPNLYISKAEAPGEYIPAPLFINKLKKTEKYVNILEIESKDKKDVEELVSKGLHPDRVDSEGKISGNMPKKLKGKYLLLSKDKEERYTVSDDIEPQMRIDYHHTKKSGKERNEPILYTNEVMKEGQVFSGTIITKGKYAAVIKKLLEDGTLRFGKSKSAQYGSCRLVRAEAAKKADTTAKADTTLEADTPVEADTTVEAAAGDIVLVSLISDGVFMNDTGYTVRFDEVRAQIAKAVEIVQDENAPAGDLFSFAATGVNYGYNTKWNMRKQPLPVISAGSTFAYKISEACVLREKMVGEMLTEGCGRIKIFKNVGYDMNNYSEDSKKGAGASGSDDGKGKADDFIKLQKDSLAAQTVRKVVSCELLKKLQGIDSFGKDFDNTQIGRLTMMLKESRADDGIDEAAFCKRVENIKNESTRAEIINWLRGTGLYDTTGGELKASDRSFTFTKAGNELFDSYEKIFEDAGFRTDFVTKNKYQILMTYLTNEKYLKKIPGSEQTDEEA